MLVLDTSGWIVLFGSEHSPTLSTSEQAVLAVVRQLESAGYQLAYTSPTLYEIRLSPRPEVRRRRREILAYLRSRGVQVGPGYLSLLDMLSFVPEAYRHDAAIALAAGQYPLLTLDSWQALFRLAMGAKTIFVHPDMD